LKNIFFIIFLSLSFLFSFENTIKDSSQLSKNIFPKSLIPGVGQLSNGKIVKSLVIISAEIYMLLKFNYHRSKFNNLNEFSENNLYLYHLNNRNKFAWYSFFVYVYSILDSTVDYHMDDLDKVFSSED